MPKVSVIIPAYNEENVIAECLESLLNQSFQDFEAIIIDDESTDRTRSIIEEYSKLSEGKIRLAAYGKVGPGRARNLSSKEAKGEIFAFMDADCRATPEWLAGLIPLFTDSKVGSAGGPHIAPPESTAFQFRVEKFFRLVAPGIGFYKPDLGGQIRFTSHNPLCNVAYRAELFLKVGGFREDLWPGEDVELDFRVKAADYQILFNPRSIVFHHRPESIQQFRKVMRAYGRAQGKLVRETGIKRPIQWLGVLCLVSLVGLFAIGFFYYSGTLLMVSLAFMGILFFFRPETDGLVSLIFNSFDWFNGFLIGFRTQWTPVPGSRGKEPQWAEAPSSSE